MQKFSYPVAAGMLQTPGCPGTVRVLACLGTPVCNSEQEYTRLSLRA